MHVARTVAVAAAFIVALSVANSARADSIGPGTQVGTNSQIAEVSGIAGSRSLVNVLWAHNDSGDSARFYAMSTAGVRLATISLSGATAIDWEDIAIAPKPGGGNYLYLGDIGDNAGNRTAGISIYRVTEPLAAANGTISASNYTKVTLKYPDLVPRNAESLLVDPWSGDLYIVTKGAATSVYMAPASIFNNPGTTSTLALLGGLKVAMSLATAADISPDGRHILLRNYSTTAYLFERGVGQSVWDALQFAPIPVTLKAELQGEAIGWAADGQGFYTTSELATNSSQPIWYYSFSVPEPSSLALTASALVVLLSWACRCRRLR